jgi:asparagine synthase (glutamine-hydrolysing)
LVTVTGWDVRNASGKPLWSGDRAPLVEQGAIPQGCQVVQDGAIRLAIVGPCHVGPQRLREGLGSVRAGRWAQLTTWPGSYWVVAQDGRSTVLITDLAGTRPFYYADGPTGIVWATSARTLADGVGSALDLGSLTARLICPTVPDVCGTGTAFTGVQRLPGGHVLLVHRDGTHQTVGYERPRSMGFSEAAEELRTALVVATGARARSSHRLTADLSGGLDSTSLVVLATAATDAQVMAVTHADATSCNEDVTYARRAAAGRANLKHIVVQDGDGLFFDDLLAAPRTDQPFPDAARWRMRAAYQQVCVDHASTAHLTGSGADTLLSVSPYYLADLAREGDVRALWEHALARARLRRLPVRSVLTGAVRLSHTSHALGLRHLADEITAGPAHPTRQESLARCTGARPRAPAPGSPPTPASTWPGGRARPPNDAT